MSQKRRSARPRAVIIHGIAHARAAAAQASALGVPLCLRSAPGAGGYAGAPWFREIVAAVRAEYPGVDIQGSLDCADQPGTALAALRDGVTLIRLRARKPVREKVAAIARTYGAALDDDRGKALDLAAEDDPEAACRAWLGLIRFAADPASPIESRPGLRYSGGRREQVTTRGGDRPWN